MLLKDKLTAKEVAAELGYHTMSVYRLLKTGKLHGEKFGNTWVIDRQSLENFKASKEADSRFYLI